MKLKLILGFYVIVFGSFFIWGSVVIYDLIVDAISYGVTTEDIIIIIGMILGVALCANFANAAMQLIDDYKTAA